MGFPSVARRAAQRVQGGFEGPDRAGGLGQDRVAHDGRHALQVRPRSLHLRQEARAEQFSLHFNGVAAVLNALLDIQELSSTPANNSHSATRMPRILNIFRNIETASSGCSSLYWRTQ